MIFLFLCVFVQQKIEMQSYKVLKGDRTCLFDCITICRILRPPIQIASVRSHFCWIRYKCTYARHSSLYYQGWIRSGVSMFFFFFFFFFFFEEKNFEFKRHCWNVMLLVNIWSSTWRTSQLCRINFWRQLTSNTVTSKNLQCHESHTWQCLAL